MSDHVPQQDTDQHRRGVLVALLLLVLLGVYGLNQWLGPHESGERADNNRSDLEDQEVDPAIGVTLAIEIEGSPRSSITLAHQPADTLLRFMEAASQQSEDWQFRYQGHGSGAFLDELAGLENEGAGGRNWLYHVNGERAEVSFGAYELAPGDRVLWKYGHYE